MSDIDRAGSSPLRRWWSIAIGVAVFIVILLIYQYVLNQLLHPTESDHLTSGYALLEVVGGFISGFVGASCSKLIAWDIDKKIFLYTGTAALIVLALIVVAAISATPDGLTFNAILVGLAIVIPGYLGLKAGAR
jgi:hypothetical protein